jgi:DNA repair exonuclease SbcCD ATPase subunit
MPQLKRSIIVEIYKRLNGKRFTEYDFEVSLPESGATLLEITLKANPSYNFRVSEEFDLLNAIAEAAGQKTRRPTSTECPGSVKSVEKHSHQSLDDAFNRINPWLENVYSDLKARTIGLKEIEDLQQQLEAHLASHSFEPDEYFLNGEITRVDERLDALLRSFEQMEKEHRITSDQLEALRDDVEQMKQAARDMPKGVWASLVKNRIVLTAKRVATSPEGRQFMLEAAKKLLLGTGTKV